MNFNKKIIPLVLVTTVSQSCIPSIAFAENNLGPKEAAYGYYVDTWKNNSTSNMNPNTNPAIGVLSEFLKVFKPGDSWNNGTVLNQDVHNHNINTVIGMTKDNTTSAAVRISNTTDAAAEIDITKFTTGSAAQVYFDDRRDQNYSITDGLGKYTDLFRELANAGTTIKDVPKDATTVLYSDKGNSNGKWADEDSELGSMVKLIDTMRNSSASTTPAKSYFQYMRPFRWSTDVNVLPTLIPAKKADSQASSDGGFPSGHTNAAYISAIGLAYAVPERFQEILTRASELGNDRIKAGMHSPLDVMGGRTMATAIAAAALYNTDNETLKADAYNAAHNILLTQEGTCNDRFSDYKENKKNYTERLTYGFDKIGESNKPMVVPKGAEVLLETRLPYLDANQRRDVLYTTGIESGYPVLDDAEGWGRLNLFAAADGYGAFNDDVTVNMDASKGGFNATDSWRNDISGTGALIKEGTGTLKLEGNNTYSGGTQIKQGKLEAESSTAFGNGSVTNDGGTLVENVSGEVNLNSEYSQSENGTLELSIGSDKDVLEINGNTVFSGKLKLDFINGYVPDNNMTIIKFKSNDQSSKFSSIETNGLPSYYAVNLIYDNNNVKLSIQKSGGNNIKEDKTELKNLYDEYKDVVQAIYSSDTWYVLQTELSNAKNTLNDDNATQDEINSVYRNLENAINSLQSSVSTSSTITTTTTSKSHHHHSSSSTKDNASSNISTNESNKDSSTTNKNNSKDNSIKTGWQQKNGVWYNLSKSGIVNTGWFKDQDGQWYYLDKSGAMQTGWFKDTDGQWYYLNQNGTMEHDKYIDGYYLGYNGAWVKY